MACLLASMRAGAADAAGCSHALLQALGWRFDVVAGIDAPRIEAGQPCDRADLADAQAHGDLRVAVPAGLDAADMQRLHDALLQHPATTCAYAFALGDATRRAVDRLVANDGYRFSALQLGWIGFGPTGAARDGWRRIASFGRGYVPRAGNWRAIEGFYHGRVRAECGVGRQVAQYAAQAELYGAEGFDAAFDASEIVIGRWRVLNEGNGILQGASAGAYTRDGGAREASRLGRQMFMGVPGFIEHSFARRYLDDINNQAQNFVVYDVDAAAADALRAQGGFATYNAMARELWALSQRVRDHGVRDFQRLLLARDPRLRARLDATVADDVARMDAIVADPFFRGFRIYVHRHGVRPVADHFVRMLDRNPRTPFHIAFALHNVHTTLRERYFAYRLGSCRAQEGGMANPSAFAPSSSAAPQHRAVHPGAP